MTDQERKAMKMALEALENADYIIDMADAHYAIEPDDREKLITALRQALAQPEPKPTLFFGRAVYFADPKTGELLDKKADNARELGLDYESVKEHFGGEE